MFDVYRTIAVGVLAAITAASVGCCGVCGPSVCGPTVASSPAGYGCGDCASGCGGGFCDAAQLAGGPESIPPQLLGRFHAVPTCNVFGPETPTDEIVSFIEIRPGRENLEPNAAPRPPALLIPPPSAIRGSASREPPEATVAVYFESPEPLIQDRPPMPLNTVRHAIGSTKSTESVRPGNPAEPTPRGLVFESDASKASPFLDDDSPRNELRSASREPNGWRAARSGR